MSRKVSFGILLLITSLSAPSASFAAPKAGAVCPKVGKIENAGGKKFTCIKSGKKTVWNKGVSTSIPSASSPDSRENASKFEVTARTAYSDLEKCKIKSTLGTNESLGFPRNPTALPALGDVNAVTLLVEFDDLKDNGDPLRVWKTQQIPTAENFFSAASYGKMKFKVDLIETVFHIKKSVLAYNLDTHHDAPAKPNAKPYELVTDAISAADPVVDFSKYNVVNVVTPSTTLIGFEGAVGLRTTVDGKLLERATFGSIREYKDALNKYNWLVHESGHNLGLFHPYNNRGDLYKDFIIPTWDLMGDAATPAAEFLAWNKFLLGWLDTNQVNCLESSSKSSTTHLITPLSENTDGVKATVIKLSETQALVIENRRNSSLNRIARNQEGVLVYVVDGSIASNVGAVTILYSKLTKTADDRLIGTLKPGDSVKHKNVTVKVLSSAVAGDYVSVTVN
jgi:M6 family metalloprotease-like protein